MRGGAGADGPTTATNGSKRTLQPSSATGWTVNEVGAWLAVLGLEQYTPAFTAHDISGGVLLDLTQGDLDYLNISSLGHRKMIMKGVEQLRAAVGASRSVAAVSADSQPAAGPRASSSSSSAAVGEAKRQAVNVVHWSQTMPQHQPQQNAGQAGAPSSVSLMDGDFDEARQAAEFQEALLAWRRSNKKSNSSASASSDAAGNNAAGGGTWTNPFDFVSGDAASSSSASAAPGSSTGAGGGGGALLQGDYDEERERRAFQDAVAAWRQDTKKDTGGAKAATNASHRPGSSTGTGTDAGGGIGAAGGGGGARSSCYHCLRVFYTSHAFIPPPPSREEAHDTSNNDGGHAVGSASSSIHNKPFCSAACYDSASMELLRAEATRTAARADLQHAEAQSKQARGPPHSSDHDNAAAAGDDNGSIEGADDAEYEYPAEQAADVRQQQARQRNASAFGTATLSPSPVNMSPPSPSSSSSRSGSTTSVGAKVDYLVNAAEDAARAAAMEFSRAKADATSASQRPGGQHHDDARGGHHDATEAAEGKDEPEGDQQQNPTMKQVDIWSVSMDDYI